jgi:hypothetical protein
LEIIRFPGRDSLASSHSPSMYISEVVIVGGVPLIIDTYPYIKENVAPKITNPSFFERVFSSSYRLAKEYTILWKRQKGDIVEQGESIAVLYPKGDSGATTTRYEFLHTRERYVYSPVSGTLRQILLSTGQSVATGSGVELALISTAPADLEVVEIFYSCTDEDETLLKELMKQLSGLRQLGLIVDWHRGNIDAGSQWQQQIDLYLSHADIIILLISPDFMASDVFYKFEAQKAMRRHLKGKARVIPVLLRPTDWRGAPFATLPMLPENAEAVTLWHNRDEAFLNIAQGIRKTTRELIQSRLTQVQHAFSEEITQSKTLETKILALEQEKNKTDESWTRLSSESDKLQQQLATFQKEVVGLEAEISENKSKQAKLSRKIRRAKTEGSWSSVIYELESEKSKADKHYTNLSHFLHETQQKLSSAQKEHSEFEAERVKIESKQMGLQQEIDRASIINLAYLEEQRHLQKREQHLIEMLLKIDF